MFGGTKDTPSANELHDFVNNHNLHPTPIAQPYKICMLPTAPIAGYPSDLTADTLLSYLNAARDFRDLN
ncbi:hypothetical protein Pmani_020975 [Petrolisthes manimaculis]|uniref:Uncharacterized protein n=1 Tax=Petrolisthes manimaculis TaxID=1843537 RepID=A0AAE1U2J8_9EUCA|nr:hypothetical protein Pmani_020975 [Petrolisthes manimaculis]